MSKRESYIEKRIDILINLGNYESLKVGSTFGETIVWESKEERQKKLDSITENLKKEVAKDVNDVLKSYELRQRSTVLEDKAGRVDLDIDETIDEDDEAVDEDFEL